MATLSLRRQTSNSHGFQHKKTIDKIFKNNHSESYEIIKNKCLQFVQVIGCDCTDCNGKRWKGNCVIETLNKYVVNKLNKKIDEETVSIMKVSYF